MLYNKQFTVEHKARWWGDLKVSNRDIFSPVKFNII